MRFFRGEASCTRFVPILVAFREWIYVYENVTSGPSHILDSFLERYVENGNLGAPSSLLPEMIIHQNQRIRKVPAGKKLAGSYNSKNTDEELVIQSYFNSVF